MKYVIGVDLGTSAVKVLLANQKGEVCAERAQDYPLIQEKSGYSEQNPEEWVVQTILALKELVGTAKVNTNDIEGISFSGQMHGLVLLDEGHQVIRNAILWNDTRTTEQCDEIKSELGESLLKITKNPALEGFTLPKILWVKENEPELYHKASVFLLPKDYLRYRLTGQIHMDYSDAAGTLLLDVVNKEWSKEICELFQIDDDLCPQLVESHAFVGNLLPEIAEQTGLNPLTKIFAGGADNACGAIGAGILTSGVGLCSIGTSGVILSYEEDHSKDFEGKVHFFNHGKQNAYYVMGVTLSAGHSLSWFKDTFATADSFEEIVEKVNEVPIGAKGMLFTPYLVGERTPHADAVIRASFIGMDSSHERDDFVRSVMEGITFSLNESLVMFRDAGINIDQMISIGGGAKNDTWLQMQADIFNAEILKLDNEQGPGMGAAMLAALGCGWFTSLEECSKQFIQITKSFQPIQDHVEKYEQLYSVYKDVYLQTKGLNEKLKAFRD
ncbi:xylulokinase [Chengkuizengella axinellae]|uniref:Xylulose kinase n=1 Tax=Chengkuizengella axinellae TaxID=3064388 RepID=A0ABT9J3T0_9BACL|nr:xylulokinase [Chengkuizengella sp. 2205SS18-9]MDP5276277.1 xylulokinase [Chengkuizengella sp. 2205SS18-9]